MDNSFDKLNSEFADKSSGGFKYWFWLVCSFLLSAAGFVIGVYAVLPGHNRYLSLLTLLGGLFGVQTQSWAKSGGKSTKVLRVAMIFGLVVAVFACVILYIIPWLFPNYNKS